MGSKRKRFLDILFRFSRNREDDRVNLDLFLQDFFCANLLGCQITFVAKDNEWNRFVEHLIEH